MSRRVEILPRAKHQLYQTAQWWADHRSSEQAIRWLDGIESAIRNLADDAERHPLAVEAAEFDFPLQQMTFGLSRRPTHRVLFSLQENRVLVYAVRHLAQRDVTPEDLR